MLLATGLLNPTDVAVDATKVFWPEYDLASGSVRSSLLTATSARGDAIGQNGPVTPNPAYAIQIGVNAVGNEIVLVTRNIAQANGGLNLTALDLP